MITVRSQPHGFTHGSDARPFNWIGASVVNKRQYKTGKVPDLPRLGKHPRREGTRRESRISGTSCRGYEFAGVRLVQLPLAYLLPSLK